MKDIIWEIAKATDSETNLDYTELGSIFQPRTLFEARGISYTAKDSTTRISKYVDSKLADDVKDKIMDMVDNGEVIKPDLDKVLHRIEQIKEEENDNG